MTIGHLAYRLVEIVDGWVATANLLIGERRGSLVTLFLHHVFADEQEARTTELMPQEAITRDGLRTTLETFAAAGYRFISLPDLVQGLDPHGKYLLLTFDDGYADNLRVLPLLEALDGRVTVFVSANHVRHQKPFWTDVVWREMAQRGVPEPERFAEIHRIATTHPHACEEEVARLFGQDALRIPCDLARPLREHELRDLARHPRVAIGNHTCNHAPLPFCDPDVAKREMLEAQTFLTAITGSAPLAIAYPYGFINPAIARLAADCGLRFGFTTESRKAHVRDLASPEKCMFLPRCQPFGSRPLPPQINRFRSDAMLLARFQAAKQAVRAYLHR